jgi:hypothetical protein
MIWVYLFLTVLFLLIAAGIIVAVVNVVSWFGEVDAIQKGERHGRSD